MDENPNLTGKNAVVMGAGSEAAQAIALAFAQAGADVALTTATADAEEAFALRRVAKRITDLGRRGFVESVDMSLGTGVQVALRQVARALGGIDILVVATSARQDKPTDRLSDAEWARVLNQNLSAVFYACRSAAREMQGREHAGRIIVLLPAVDEEAGAAYAAARAGVATFVEALAREWAGRPVAVNGISVAASATEEAARATAVLALRLAEGTGESTSGHVIAGESG